MDDHRADRWTRDTPGWTDRIQMESHTFADVVVFSPAQASGQRPAFTYDVPRALKGSLVAGSLVVVPFGSRRLYGIVVRLSDRSPVPETRSVESLVDPQPVLKSPQIALARWMSDEYLAPLHECLELLLPPGIVGHADLRIALRGKVPHGAANTEAQARLLALLQRRGPLRGSQLDAAMRGVDWRAASEQLARRDVVTRESFLAPPRAEPKRMETVRLIPDVDHETALAGLRSDYYPLILNLLHPGDHPVGIQRVYEETGCSRYHLNKLEARGIIAFGSAEAWRDSLADEVFVPTTPPPLT
ncbi:MAG: hypothetical protein ACP5JJ_18550, partial [Anaerolineae bacterium]